MDPLTRTRPKPLLPVAGYPILEHLVNHAVAAGFTDISLVVHEAAEQIRDHFGDGGDFGATIRYVDQGEPRGTGHAIAALDGHIDDKAVVVSGDSLLSPDDLQHLRDAPGIAVAGKPVSDVSGYGLLNVDDGLVHGVAEKPESGGAGIANAGAYQIDQGFIDACKALKPSPRGELEVTDAIDAMAGAGQHAVFVACHSWLEAGRPWDLLDLQEAAMGDLETRIDGDVGDGVEIDGPVVVEAGARVFGHTVIEGPVYVGANAQVGPNAYLRPHVSIGAGAHIGNSTEVKNSIIGAGSNAPHLSYVGDSVIGADCNLGAGSQVANLKISDRNVRVRWQGKEWLDTGRRKLGVIMADGVKTGVNASINPGTVLCPGVRVGAGEVVSGWIEAEG